MADLLVKLYGLPPAVSAPVGPVAIRPAMAYEKHVVLGWVRAHFGEGWASECDVAFANRPIACHIAVEQGAMLGFACYDATCRGFFGPLGVADAARRRGIGRALLLSTLHAMSSAGYAYAIIGGTDSADFYAQAAGAIEIPNSTPGIYRDRLNAVQP